ncbi:MAG: phosphocholine cytidylyltransferase family protein [Flavobacteriales bacterium]|nr:phosphocholine cytidylyltransferase family protein [Bacteroidota bacterium]MCB9239865.1 phosphocholine cytidylyltransferase family protein [Flavobacteriales bacterium]
MKSIILAAGQGTRLRPYTDSVPKTMVKLRGKSLIEYQRDILQSFGIDIHVLVGYKKQVIQDAGFQTIENPEYDHTNMVASLYCARSLFDGSDDILITYGDIIFESRLLEGIFSDQHDVAMVYDQEWLKLWSERMDDPLSDVETFQTDSNGYVLELGKKPKHLGEVKGQYIGMIKVAARYAPHFFDRYRELEQTKEKLDGQDFNNMYMTSYLQSLINSGIQVKAVPSQNGWLEVDSVEDLERYEELIESGKMSNLCNLF